MICAAQKVEHYEIASYGCLHEWAGVLGNEEAANLLEEILNEEKATNRSLTGLARERSNQEALGEFPGGDVEAAGAAQGTVSAQNYAIPAETSLQGVATPMTELTTTHA